MTQDTLAKRRRRATAGAAPKPAWWFRRARTGATLAACLYVVLWGALLGDFAHSLNMRQQVSMALVSIASGALIWVAVRAIILQQRFLARQESMEAFEESRAFVRALMDNLPAAVWLKSRDHRYVAGNQPWVRTNPMLPRWQAKSVDKLIGRTDRELFPPEKAEEFEATDDLVFTTGQTWEKDYDEIQGGEHRLYHTMKIPVRDLRGVVRNVVGIGMDVTELRRNEQELERSRQQLNAFLERSFEHICVVGMDRRIMMANARLCEFLGTSSSLLVGRDVADVLIPEDRVRGAAFFGRVVAGGDETLQVFGVQDASGVVRQVEVSAALIRADGNPDTVVVIGRDTTERDGSQAADESVSS
jgi:PAS domain S-box-containing protein